VGRYSKQIDVENEAFHCPVRPKVRTPLPEKWFCLTSPFHYPNWEAKQIAPARGRNRGSENRTKKPRLRDSNQASTQFHIARAFLARMPMTGMATAHTTKIGQIRLLRIKPEVSRYMSPLGWTIRAG
jgi:hypothetical protein